MNGSEVAHYLVILLPWAAAIRTLIFIILSVILYMQRSSTILGRWITGLFLATTASNAATTWFVWYIVRGVSRSPLHLGMHEWLIVMTMAIFPIITGVTGIMVTYYTIKEGNDDGSSLAHLPSGDDLRLDRAGSAVDPALE